MRSSLLAIEVVLVAALVVAVVGGHRSRMVLKPLASVCFIAVGLLGARHSPGLYGLMILIGLSLGAIGDVALLRDDDGSFRVGLTAFLAGHLAYTAAFASGSVARLAVVGIAAGTGIGWFSFRWLKPHLTAPLDRAIAIYVVVIALMVAAGLSQGGQRPGAAVGSVLFALSDLAVARERFVTRSNLNPVLGLPLYYLAQVLIALSI